MHDEWFLFYRLVGAFKKMHKTGSHSAVKHKQLLDLFSWRAWWWPNRSKHVAL